MRFLSVLLRLLGVLLILFAGVLLLVLAMRLLLIEEISNILTFIYDSPKIRLLLGVIGGAILLVTVALAHMIVQQIQRERTIAFRNPDGEVTVALEAIEDFIKKLGSDLNGIKEIKPYVRATRSGLLIKIRVTLWSDTRIPETTEGLQSIIQDHIHEILGAEEPITIHVHVEKVISRTKKDMENLAEEKGV